LGIGLRDTFPGLIITYQTFLLPLVIWMMRGYFAELPAAMEESAMVEGYTRMGALLRVVLPVVWPGIVATSVLCFIFAWNEFLYAFLLGGRSVKTLPVAIPTLITGQGVLWGELAVVGVIAIVPVFVVVFYLQRHIIRGLTLGAVKG